MTDLDEAVRITADLEENVDGPIVLTCPEIEFIRPIPEPFDDLEERLVDLFCRLEHETSVARLRAATVLEVVRLHLEVSA